jgi:hypothetical protein
MEKEIYTHPIFHDLLNNFRFFFAGINMMCKLDFQKALIDSHKGEKSELEISAKYDDLNCLKYDIRDIFTSFNKAVKLELVGDKVKANIIDLMNFQARQIAISLFDILQFSKYRNFVVKNDINLFKFTKHIRNGAAHNNKFFFDAKSKLGLPVEWRGKTIENSFHCKKIVFNEFLTPADLILLIADISSGIKSCK